MYIDNILCDLIADLEYQIGKECYNPNSHNGVTGDDGCSFRYPLTIRGPLGKTYKIKGGSLRNCANVKVTVNNIKTMKYEFGSNRLNIGKGILNILEYLEERYDLDFERLEEDYKINNGEIDLDL